MTQNSDEKRIIPNFADVMKQYEGKLVGILGTIIIHLIGAIIFMSVKLSSVYHEKRSEFLIEFENEKIQEEELIEVPLSLEELFENDDRYRDIVRNIANEDVADVDPAAIQDRVKEELIASGKITEENFIDEKKNEIDAMDEGDTAIENSETDIDSTDTRLSANELSALYQGPTRVYYYLKGRYHRNLPIPIYKCENSGKIVVNIVVGRNGLITDYSLNESESTTSDPCLFEAAISTIKRTVFNSDSSADKKQTGTVTYEFVEQ